MEWSGMLLLMVDHILYPRLCLAEEGLFLGPPPGWLWLDFISSLTNMDPYGSVFSSSDLSPWPNIYIDVDSLTFHPHINNYR